MIKARGTIRLTVKRELFPGNYGPIKVKSQTGEALWIETAHLYNAFELREAAHLFNQLAEYLENPQN